MLAGCMARKILIKMIAPRFVKLRIFVKTIYNIIYNIIYMIIWCRLFLLIMNSSKCCVLCRRTKKVNNQIKCYLSYKTVVPSQSPQSFPRPVAGVAGVWHGNKNFQDRNNCTCILVPLLSLQARSLWSHCWHSSPDCDRSTINLHRLPRPPLPCNGIKTGLHLGEDPLTCSDWLGGGRLNVNNVCNVMQ